MSKIIGIAGWIGSGKDTVADYLVNTRGFKRVSWAGTLKDAVAAVFHWDRELLEGKTKEAREWREQVDTWWAKRLGIPHLTPRWTLQQWGTEVCRTNFHNDIWIASVECALRSSADDVVISDCRFPNEFKSVKQMGGSSWWVHRGPMPEWYNVGYQAAVHNNAECVRQMNDIYRIHSSEWSWIGTEFDSQIENNGTLDELFAKVDALVRN